MPKHKQYSRKYRRRISQHVVQEIENNLQADKCHEMAYLAGHCDSCLLEVNDKIDSTSKITPDEIIQEIVQEEIVPKII